MHPTRNDLPIDMQGLLKKGKGSLPTCQRAKQGTPIGGMAGLMPRLVTSRLPAISSPDASTTQVGLDWDAGVWHGSLVQLV